ncbi:MAG: MbnP family copper-binding protein [Myxococcota bacterium]|nr:MbnP family copper-binding protein [Myxococcota bacterium]
MLFKLKQRAGTITDHAHSTYRRQSQPYWSALALIFGLALSACGESTTEEPAPQPVTIHFAVTVDGAPFACGAPFVGLGTPATEMGFGDLRFYLHGLELIDVDGEAASVTLEDDGIWQRDGVALLDFEDGCENGTAQLNNVVRGQVRAGDFVALRFSLGVPPTLNSSGTVLEGRGSPLNLSSMFWSWKSGYKYLRLDGNSGPFRLHLGASRCDSDFQCGEMNIPQITIREFNPEREQIELDLARLLEGTNLAENTPMTAPGCMGESSDPDCTEIFARIGLGDEAAILAWSASPLEQ